jgi:hypothetical protein
MAFGTPEWTIAYEAAVDEVIAVFREQGVTVYWIGLPPMRSAKHDEAVRAIADAAAPAGACQRRQVHRCGP